MSGLAGLNFTKNNSKPLKVCCKVLRAKCCPNGRWIVRQPPEACDQQVIQQARVAIVRLCLPCGGSAARQVQDDFVIVAVIKIISIIIARKCL